MEPNILYQQKGWKSISMAGATTGVEGENLSDIFLLFYNLNMVLYNF